MTSRPATILSLLLALAAIGPATALAAEPLAITSITPGGTNVRPARQIVFQFNRPVVPIGRMDRRDDEIPIAIEPALACSWRWIDTSALACQLGDGDAFRPATRYTITVDKAFAADDGTTLADAVTGGFETERPRVGFASFSTWRGPGTPVIRVVFNQAVPASSVAAHLFITAGLGARQTLEVEADRNDRTLPRFMPLPGENAIVDFGGRQTEVSEDEAEGREAARRVWLVSPPEPLPGETGATLFVEPGLVSAEGPLPGDERRPVVEFETFSDYRFTGVVCWPNGSDRQILIRRSNAPVSCNPMMNVGLQFSTPTIPTEVRDHVEITPDLAGGRSDYDPWANAPTYSQLGRPHVRGQGYVVWLPERLQADATYTLATTAESPRDEFGRTLPAAINFEFRTDHRPPDYTITHPLAVIESGIDSAVPIYVTNLGSASIDYRRVTPAGVALGLSRTLMLSSVEDVQYGLPIGLREMLDGGSGAIFGRVRTTPVIAKPVRDQVIFAEVTPFQVHVKLGHYNSLVWVTALATGEPVRDAQVSVYVDRLESLNANTSPMAQAVTDRDGLAELPGSSELDPDLALSRYACGRQTFDLCPRLFVRIDHAGEMALLPLENRFEVNAGRVSSFSVYSAQRPKYGHLKTWGTTAQGVYRTGDTIDYKLWVRDQSAKTLVPAPTGPYRLEIVDPAGQVASSVDDIELSGFGAFDGRFSVPETAQVGWYRFRLRAMFDDWAGEPMRVLVADFTPSPFRVAASLDGDTYVAGAKFTVEAEATLFSGGAYRDADARITASLSSLGFRSSDPIASSFVFGGERERRTLQLGQQTGAVDAAGRLVEQFEVPGDLGKTMTYARLRVEAAVRDDRGRYIANTATARVLAVDRLVGLKLDKWLFSEDVPADFKTIVVDPEGTPVAGTRVATIIERLETKATRVRGAGNAFLTNYVDEWIEVAACDGVSTAQPAGCSFVPEDPGRYRITARVTDTAGRPHETTLSAWVQGKGQVVWDSGTGDALEVVPEAAGYGVGDTARYLVQNPYPGAKALITIERYGVVDQWVEDFATSTPVVSFEVKPDYLPGFYLSILVMSPRVEAPLPEAGELDLGKPAFKMAYLRVPVNDPYKALDIDVETDAQSYKPRDTVHVKIRAKPLNRDVNEPIEVAAVVLDEAVLDLIAGGTDYFDPYAGFNSLEGLDVVNYGLLTRLVGRQRIELKGASPGGDGGAALSMRSLFKFVAFFDPSIELDRRGRGEFELELPDNLTGWRVLVLGATPTDRFGLGESDFTVTRPTEIRPLMPNQVSEGDRFNAGASIMNRTDTARVLNVRIEAEGNLSAPVVHEETLALAPFERGEVHVPLTAASLPLTRDRAAGSVRFRISAGDALDGDALSHELPVEKRRVLQTAASFGTLSGEPATEPLAFPEAIRPDAGEVGLELYPSVIGNIDGAFRAARDSDYQLWEQMLTKAVMASHYRALKAYVSSAFSWPGSDNLTASILAEAASYQAPNGGMSYLIPEDAYVSPYLSAYTALAFEWLRRDGVAIPEAVDTKLAGYLDTLLRRDTVPDFYTRGMTSDVRAVALAAEALRGSLSLADLSRYREHVEYMSLFGKAHYLIAAAAVPGAGDIAAEVGRMIMQASTRSAGKLSFDERLDDGYTRILATPMRAQCAILSALTHAPESLDGAAAFALVRTITQTRGDRDYWQNAQENMFCMNALTDYAAAFETAPPAIDASAAIDGEPLGTARFDDLREPSISLRRPIAAGDAGKRRTLDIASRGTGRIYYAARMSYAESAAASQRVNAGIDVRRELSVERDGEWALLDNDARVAQGDLVRVDLFVSLPTARQFVVVDDPVPGGLEPVNRDLANASAVDAEAGGYEAAGGSWWFRFGDWHYYAVSRYSFNHEEIRHDAVRFYADYLPPGNYVLSYTAQAIAGGTYARGPVRANEVYDPDVYGVGLEGSLTVTGP